MQQDEDHSTGTVFRCTMREHEHMRPTRDTQIDELRALIDLLARQSRALEQMLAEHQDAIDHLRIDGAAHAFTP